MTAYRVRRRGPLRGRARVPGDKSIGHRGVLFGALGRGPSVLRGLATGEDNRATVEAMRAMGVGIELSDDPDGGLLARIAGVGLRGLRMPAGVIDCGNSGTTMRLLAGLLSGQRFGTRLVGDASLTRRPMGRVVGPLRARGAHIQGCDPEGRAARGEEQCYPPLSVAPLVEGEALLGLEYDMPVASAQVKSCLLLSGLYAGGPTALKEPVLSRDHTERMLVALGVPLQTMGPVVMFDPADAGWSGGWDGFDWQVPGDISSAAFLLCAALMVEGSDVTIEGVGINPTRIGILDALRHMRVQSLASRGLPEGAGGEPRADLRIGGGEASRPRGALIGGELLVRMIDEVPVLAALAATAEGTTEIRDAQELRVKESDRIAAMHEVLTAFGCPCEELEDGMIVTGGQPLRGATVESRGDHRIAMSAALLGMVAEGETLVRDVQCVATSFPTFVSTLQALGADIEEIDE